MTLKVQGLEDLLVRKEHVPESIVLADFSPFNRWELDVNGEKWRLDDKYKDLPRFIIDTNTSRPYLNEPKSLVRTKCVLLTLATPVFHTLGIVLHVALRIFKTISLYHFWIRTENEAYGLKSRITATGKDLLWLVASPMALIGMEFAAIYGLFTPYNGRKLYASLERATYGGFVLAPCFQPRATEHFFGSDINKRGGF